MNVSRLRLALIAALALAVLAICIVRPPWLTVHRDAPAIVHTADPVAPPVPIHARPRPLVYVAGAVLHPGVYALDDGARAGDALAKAGGAARDADLVAVNLAAHVSDGDEIAVPHRGDPPPGIPAAHRRTAHAGGAHRRHRSSPNESTRDATSPERAHAAPLDINAASEDALAHLPGIGPVLARRIVDFRSVNGPFSSVDGLADVAGITPARLDELERLVTAAP